MEQVLPRQHREARGRALPVQPHVRLQRGCEACVQQLCQRRARQQLPLRRALQHAAWLVMACAPHHVCVNTFVCYVYLVESLSSLSPRLLIRTHNIATTCTCAKLPLWRAARLGALAAMEAPSLPRKRKRRLFLGRGAACDTCCVRACVRACVRERERERERARESERERGRERKGASAQL
jgi:hypothetical protein